MNFCVHCGADMDDSSKFCTNCGAKVISFDDGDDAVDFGSSNTSVSDYVASITGTSITDNGITGTSWQEYDIKSNQEQSGITEDQEPNKAIWQEPDTAGNQEYGNPEYDNTSNTGSNVIITRHKRSDAERYQRPGQENKDHQNLEIQNSAYTPAQASAELPAQQQNQQQYQPQNNQFNQQYNHRYNQPQNHQYNRQQHTGHSGKSKKPVIIITVLVLLLLIVTGLFLFLFDGIILINNIFSGDSNIISGPELGDETLPPVASSPEPEQNDTPTPEPELIFVTVPDLIGMHKDEADLILKELGLLPEYLFFEDDMPEDSVIWIDDIGSEVLLQSRVRVHVSSGPSYIIIENPKIVVTTRYDSGSGVFLSRDAYADAIRAAGGIPVLPGDDNTLGNMFRTGSEDNAAAIAEQYDGLLLTGGGDISARFFGQERHFASEAPDENCDIAELALCRAFINAGKPVLGINRGMQIINVAMGGDIIQDIPDLLGIASDVHSGQSRHTIQIEPDTWLHGMYGNSLITYSNHHQAVGRIADGLTIAARYGDVIEAIEKGNILGVQFNPERLADGGKLIYSDFINRCRYINAP